MIPFNIPPVVGSELSYIGQVIHNRKRSGDGEFTKKCSQWIEQKTATKRALLTTSGTHALEMSALLCNFEPGDEVILPSFTFSSTANAFIIAGAKLIFVDIRPDTTNFDEAQVEAALTPSTKAIRVVPDAGISCEMDVIMDIAVRHGLWVIQDATQVTMSHS